jgi:radical SAM superfamily enzyme YgiQ (UPF0313 family)
VDGVPYRRTVDSRVVRTSDDFEVPVDASDEVHNEVAVLAAELARELADPDRYLELSGVDPSRDHLIEFLQRASLWTLDRQLEQRARYDEAYGGPIEILPPDRYMDIVAVPATGCPNATCPFCAFYLGNKLRVKPAAEWKTHLDRVKELLGPGLRTKTGIFLGSASALSLGQKRLVEILADVQATFGPRKRGVAAFWDPDHTPPRTETDWRELHDAGLRTAYVGLETGDPELRAAINKSPDLDALMDKVRVQRSGGVWTGLIVMVGLTDPDRFRGHLEATAKVIEALDLHAKREVVFVSPFEDQTEKDELVRQQDRMLDALREVTAARVAPYAMKRFRYYA